MAVDQVGQATDMRWSKPLLLALITVEFADMVFAVDSVPAIFAILDLRALYFALAAMGHHGGRLYPQAESFGHKQMPARGNASPPIPIANPYH